MGGKVNLGIYPNGKLGKLEFEGGNEIGFLVVQQAKMKT